MNTKLQKHLDNMSVEEKALLTNLLMREVYPATLLQGECTISGIFESYDKETNIILDSLIWRVWGLHYKEYLAVYEHGKFIGIDPFKFEKGLDKRITYFMEELFNKGLQTVYQF